ncbi:MAG: transglutaminase family protein [Gemmatimonadaceae bacterium]|nr:transglutaminase family protein [Gemmatimonadaceae bacterium]
MRLLVRHQSTWAFPSPATLGPHLIRLRPASHTRANIEAYQLAIRPTGDLRWIQDPYGNAVARLTYRTGVLVEALDVTVEFSCDIAPVNPFDFLVDARCATAPFHYPPELGPDLAPFLDRNEESVRGGARLAAFLDTLPTEGDTVHLMMQLNAAVHQLTQYVVREEVGIWTPERTLLEGCGSCRDSAVLLIAALRSRGLAARFVSGYLIQLADEASIVGTPAMVTSDDVALHAWAEVYVPGGGWIGLDATSGLLCGAGHVPLACTSSPPQAAPVEGTSDIAAGHVAFAMQVDRLEPVAPDLR